MHKTNDVEKVRGRERWRRGGWKEGRNGPECISALLSPCKGIIKKSVSRACWNLFGCAYARVHGSVQTLYAHTATVSQSARTIARAHVCVACKIMLCVFGERDLLNYLHTEVFNWYQVFKWGQMNSFMLRFFRLESVSLHLELQCGCFIGLEPLKVVFAYWLGVSAFSLEKCTILYPSHSLKGDLFFLHNFYETVFENHFLCIATTHKHLTCTQD